MRIVLVGRLEERARLRGGLDLSRVQIAGEFETLRDVDAATVRADAVLLAYRAGTVGDRRGGETGSDDGDFSRAEESIERLTPREVDVLELLAEGLPNRSIANRLGISDQTVKFHVASISGKLGASNRTDVVRRAVRRGLITL